jgi:5-methylcytosine-specific restriction endonuclease McrA
MPKKVPTHRSRLATAAVRSRGEINQRKEDNRFYASAAWRKLRAEVLRDYPLCEKCREDGIYVPAVDVDHIKPRKKRPDLALERSNLRGLCKSCHNAIRYLTVNTDE